MIDKLEMLIALAREQHFGRAAAACHVTQPTLSSAIKSLEDQLGATLVNRGPRYLGLTDEGERVLARARIIVAEARALRADLAAARSRPGGVLRLGVIPTALIEARLYTAPFLAEHPGVRLRLCSMTSHQILAALADFEIDAGLSYAQTDLRHDRLSGIEALPLYDEHYALLTPVAPGLPARLTWADLAGRDLGLLTPDMQNRRIIDQHLAAAEVTLRPRVESNSILTLVGLVQTGRIATVLPERIARFFAQVPGLACLPIADPAAPQAHATVALILPPQGRRSALLDIFVRRAMLIDKANGVTETAI